MSNGDNGEDGQSKKARTKKMFKREEFISEQGETSHLGGGGGGSGSSGSRGRGCWKCGYAVKEQWAESEGWNTGHL